MLGIWKDMAANQEVGNPELHAPGLRHCLLRGGSLVGRKSFEMIWQAPKRQCYGV
jgi:hypothetical protein